jgi:hypothetical protein
MMSLDKSSFVRSQRPCPPSSLPACYMSITDSARRHDDLMKARSSIFRTFPGRGMTPPHRRTGEVQPRNAPHPRHPRRPPRHRQTRRVDTAVCNAHPTQPSSPPACYVSITDSARKHHDVMKARSSIFRTFPGRGMTPPHRRMGRVQPRNAHHPRHPRRPPRHRQNRRVDASTPYATEVSYEVVSGDVESTVFAVDAMGMRADDVPIVLESKVPVH